MNLFVHCRDMFRTKAYHLDNSLGNLLVGPQIAPKKSAKARIELRTTHLNIHRPDDPQIAKPNEKSYVGIELRTSHLHVHRPTRYPDKTFPYFDYDCILTQAWCGTQDKFGQTAFPEMQLVQILMLRFAVCQ